MPRVSVIIPTYNRAFFLCEAVESVLNQTFRDFELIVVDDGSTDPTPFVLRRWKGKVRWVRQENSGVSRARNVGIQCSRGRYICFLDSDDLWLRGKLEAQVDFLDANPHYPVCYTDEIWIRRGRRVNPGRVHAKYSGWIFDRCLPLCIISPSSVMMRREVLDVVGGFDEDLPVCEDYDLWLRIASRYPIFFLDIPLIVKRGGHADQLSNRSWGNDRYRVLALSKQLAGNRLLPSERQAAVEMLEKKCLILARGFLKRGRIEEAMRYRVLAGEWRESRVEQAGGRGRGGSGGQEKRGGEG
ncbi:MAG: glycosyltransferase [Deltaproteobacteria bacterium]|nr:glycosyltransferase [Deltaproteobacteria bacterium]